VPTIADEADAAGLSWRYYTYPPLADGGIWSAYQNIKHIYEGSDWTSDVITPASEFFADVAAGQLANITWITPTCENSDHPACTKRTGPAWVTRLVDAIGKSQFWPSTAIFIIWDDWGGFFDPAAPSYEDYDGPGFRIPMLVISPYAKKGYVSHIHFETASVLRYIEDNFGLVRLAAADARASDPAYDALDYTAKPRRFIKLRGGKPPSFWKGEDRTRTGVREEPASDEGD
jgi:phospholipase C